MVPKALCNLPYLVWDIPFQIGKGTLNLNWGLEGVTVKGNGLI